jgi:hypothetical protein
MGTDIFDGVELAVHVEYGHDEIICFHDLVPAGRYFVDGSNIEPILGGHFNLPQRAASDIIS